MQTSQAMKPTQDLEHTNKLAYPAFDSIFLFFFILNIYGKPQQVNLLDYPIKKAGK